ncbi:alpha-L-rhamnosidase C-terminal domain-containing protein [Mucilaginibacter pedocola]|uniref:Alpha-L-rhamnosidase C-terminal domain-containing protein n=1 Tax=Mucilaginibacter pedocola TaxID=1792845 RepID=A0A1S9PDV5_9SPHI|nr:alpha-L-rhamnosidase C-terminal domain-containing protein [Mucilaginibacter pedocola]OOQ58768.1 hypothetical protein BC343_08935 [Mucilaginibacter pedocola]
MGNSLLRFLLVYLTVAVTSAYGQSHVYKPVSAKKSAAVNPLSPDPIFSYRWDNPKASDELEAYTLKPVLWHNPAGNFKMDAYKSKGEITVIGAGDIRFDFGQENAGWLEFESDDVSGDVEMSISEYNEPAVLNAGAEHPVKTLGPVKHGNIYRLELNRELYEGVRFGWIHVRKFVSPWHIRNLRLVCQTKPVNYRGSFASSDAELTRIWYTGAYTVKLNLQKDYFGAILMERSDRHSWTGDAYPSQAASMVAFGNYDFVKLNLTNTSGLNNGILSYSLYWVLSLIDYANYTGDTAFVRKYISNACSKLDTAYNHFGKQNHLGFYGWDERLGAGFENPDNPESQRAYQMLSIRSWAEFGGLMNQLGETALAKKYTGYAEQKMASIRENRGWVSAYGLHASADAVNTRLTTPQEDSLFFKANYTDRVNRLSYSPFNQYFVIAAMAKMNRYDDAISAVKDSWGGQLKYGGTTFFEVFRPDWNNILKPNDAPINNQCGYTSLCHPWSAGVTKWLSEEVLGIKPLAPGFRVFEIWPHLGSSLSWVKGRTPLASGIISVDINVASGKSSFSVPANTMASRVAIPFAQNVPEAFYINNKLVYKAGQRADTTLCAVRDGYFILKNVAPGNYQCKAVYKIKRAQVKPSQQNWAYAIPTMEQDSLTRGNWTNKYGKSGYMLFNDEQTGAHLQKLPSYVKGVTIKMAGDVHKPGIIGSLADTLGHPGAFGALVTKDPQPTAQCITMDIISKDKARHQLALYFLDDEGDTRRTAVEVFDADSLKILSPVQLIKNYEKGKYLKFNYTGNIRIRVCQVRGKNAAVSGLFFD